jgi:methyl-accepting chemotaxis protein
MTLNNVNISKKLAIGFTVVVIIVTAMCGTVYRALQDIHAAIADNDESVAQLKAADTALTTLVERQNSVRGYVGSGAAEFITKAAEHQKEYETAIAYWAKISPEDSALIASVKQVSDEAIREMDQQMADAKDPTHRAEVATTLTTRGRLVKPREAIKAFTDQESAKLAERSKKQAASQALANMVLAVGGALSIALSILMGWLLSRAIATPISKMTDVMGLLASGDNDVEVPAIGRKDELGRMAEAVQSFKNAAIEKIRLEGEAAEQRRATEEERRSAEAERAAAATEQSHVVEGLAQGLERLAAGVLTFRLNAAFAPHYEKLRADFNAAMQQMQSTISEVATNTAGVRTASTEISQASDNLSRRTEQQAASLEETAAALDQITATVRKTAEGAKEARDAVGSARADAERSGVVVRDAVAAMSEIESSAQQISQIIGVIDEIAFQTNLLAHNAGVEAARAGDAGRGFALR